MTTTRAGFVAGLSFLVMTATTQGQARPELGAVEQVIRSVTNYLHAEIAEPAHAVRLADGTMAETVIFRRTEWELKSMPQSVALSSQMDREARALPEKERLERMDRFDDYTQLWSVFLKDSPEADERLKILPPPNPKSHRYYRERAFLGTGKGRAWYTHMPVYDWIYLQKQLGFKGGEDPLAAAEKAVTVDDLRSMTRNSAEAILTAGGTRAIPYLKQLLTSTNFGIALRALAPMQEREATALLIETATGTNPARAADARYMLESYPRAEAEGLYLKWIEEDAGRQSVARLLAAGEMVAPKKLAPFLPRIVESPKSIFEFRHAFELSRSLGGKPIPAPLLRLEQDIKHFGYASSTNFDQRRVSQIVSQVLKSGDVEAAAVIAISLATAVTKGDWHPANRAGRNILRGLPNGYGLDTARRVAASIPDEWVKGKLNLKEN